MTLLLLQSGPGKAGVAATGPVNTVLPVISGTTVVGSTLSTTDGTWTGTPTIAYTYQWKNGGTNISGATANTYLLVTADLAATITVTVTATNTAGSNTATSSGVGPVTAFATFNGTPSAGVVMSNGNLTATHGTTNAAMGVNNTNFLNAGKYYFEIKIQVWASNADNHSLGMKSSAATMVNVNAHTNSTTTYIGSTSNIWSNNANTSKNLGAPATNDVFGFAVDLSNSLAWIRRNNGLWNADAAANPVTGVNGVVVAAGSYAPVVCFGGGGSSNIDVLTGNFGQSSYANAAPSGFGNWPG